MVDFGGDNALPAAHMPTIRWLSASIAWMRASSEPVRGCRGFNVLLMLNADINRTSYLHAMAAPDKILLQYTIRDRCNSTGLQIMLFLAMTINITLLSDTDNRGTI